ncbi:MAG: hypothetical protein GXN92_02490 [Candidatus Micrarchaeota archaeon]|nr:hypothetical protein [Candidatus Micrarchaeota archaeon]
MRIGVVGRKEFALGFYVAGIPDVYFVETEEEFNKKIDELYQSDYGLIICDNKFKVDRKILKKYLGKTFPVLLYLGDVSQLKEEIKEALGIEVMK